MCEGDDTSHGFRSPLRASVLFARRLPHYRARLFERDLARWNPSPRCLHAIDQYSSPLSGSTREPAVGYSPQFPTSTPRPLPTRGVAHLYARPSMERHGRRACGAERTVALSSPYRKTSGARRATAIAYASDSNSIRSDGASKRRHGRSAQRYGFWSRKFTAPLACSKRTRTVQFPALPTVVGKVPLSAREREYTCVPSASRMTSDTVPERLLGD